jgi:hypothetical protein
MVYFPPTKKPAYGPGIATHPGHGIIGTVRAA